jgi:hypothetical protein
MVRMFKKSHGGKQGRAHHRAHLLIELFYRFSLFSFRGNL